MHQRVTFSFAATGIRNLLWLSLALPAVLIALSNTTRTLSAELLQNGDFESGLTSWKRNDTRYANVVNGDYPLSGIKYGFVGDQDSDRTTDSTKHIGSLFQDFFVPPDATVGRLRFSLNVSTKEIGDTEVDVMEVNLRAIIGDTDPLLERLVTSSNKDSGGNIDGDYSPRDLSLNLLPYRGQNIRLQFYAVTINKQSTIFRIDDVSITTSEKLPDLIPWRPPDWPQQILISKSASSLSDDLFAEGDTAFVRFAVGNQGAAPTSGSIYTFLFFDGAPFHRPNGNLWDFSFNESLPTGGFHSFADGFPIPQLTAGTHTLTVKTGWSDSGGTVKLLQSDVANDELSRVFTVGTTLAPPSEVAVAFDGTAIRVQWQDNSPDETRFTIRRREPNSGATLFFTAEAGITSWNDTAIMEGVTYCYSVQAIRGPTESAFSSESCAARPVSAPLVAAIQGPDNAIYGEPVTYRAVGVTGLAPITFAWSIPGSSGSDSSFTVTFNPPLSMSQEVVLTVTDASSRTYTARKRVTVTGKASTPASPGLSTSRDPVNLATGDYLYEHTDLRMPGRGFGFEFKRSYNSRVTRRNLEPLGPGWTHSYNIFLTNTGPSVLVTFGDGHVEAYFPAEDGGYQAEPGVFNMLTKAGDVWLLTDKRQTILRFDGSGRLQSITDRNGNRLGLHYTGSDLTRIVDTGGREIRLVVEAGRITQIIDPADRTNRFNYSPTHDLIEAVDPKNQTNSYTYNDAHQITDASDGRGIRYVHNEYLDGIVSGQHDAYTNWTWFTFDFTNRVTLQTNALGGVSRYEFDHRLLTTNVVDEAGHTNSFAYDDALNRFLEVDKKRSVTRFGHDRRGNLTSRLDALGGEARFAYDERSDLVWQRDALTNFTYFGRDDRGNLTSTTNALGQVTRILPNAFGLPELVTDARTNSTRNVWDAQGNLTAVINALGHTNRFTYDAVGRRTGFVDGRGQTNSYAFDANDNLILTLDPLGGRATATFDANNNRTSTTDARGATTTNLYDLKDRVVVIGDALHHRATNRYDALDRKVEVIDARGNSTRFLLDAVGNLTNVINALGQTNQATFDPNGNQLTATDPEGHTSTNQFDPLNRPVATFTPLGHSNLMGYDALGRLVTTTNANGHVTSLRRDPLGRVTKVEDAAQGSVLYAYDENGNRVTVTDPNGHAWTNRFDALNRLAAESDPLGHHTDYDYDESGNLADKLTPNGVRIGYAHDARNGLTNIAYSTGESVAFLLDAGGLRTKMMDALGTTTWRHDLLGRLESTTDPFGQTVEYRYDEVGNRARLLYPGGKEVGYRYDELNRLAAFTNWLGGVTSYDFDRRGVLTNTANQNGTHTVADFDDSGRLQSFTSFASGGATIASYALALDGVGNLTNQVHREPLVPIVHSQTNTYTYDDDNRLTSVDGRVVTHDDNGNLTAIGADSFGYDAENRLTTYSVGTVPGTAAYDGLGLRLALTTTNVTRRFVHDRASTLSQLLVETDTNGAPVAFYVYGRGLAQSITPTGDVLYYHFDPRGNTVALTDAVGATTDAYAYLAFGEPGDTVGDSPQGFRFSGQYGIVTDSSGLCYARARYFSPELGRFLTKDPLKGGEGVSQELNRYAYALNNPIRFIDPSGLTSQDSLNISTQAWFLPESFGTPALSALHKNDAMANLQPCVLLGPDGQFNYIKAGVGIFRIAKGIGSIAVGSALSVAGASIIFVGGETLILIPVGVELTAIGVYTITSGTVNITVGVKQVLESRNDSTSGEVLNLLGILPLGSRYDDKSERDAIIKRFKSTFQQ